MSGWGWLGCDEKTEGDRFRLEVSEGRGLKLRPDFPISDVFGISDSPSGFRESEVGLDGEEWCRSGIEMLVAGDDEAF